jgi:hypothetical protein
VDPDPEQDPIGFGPPGSGSGSVSQSLRGTDPDPSIVKQNNKKNLDSYYFVTSL